MDIRPLDFTPYKNIVFLTGAGVSAASGVPTFRGSDGLWHNREFLWAADGANLPQSLPIVWKVFGSLRAKAGEVHPNAAHHAIADLQKRHQQTKNITVITQNVDDLHQRAGSHNVIDLHGTLFRSRCTNPQCYVKPFHDTTAYDAPPACPRCGSPLRPDIVLFNEMLPALASHQAKRALRDCNLFIAVGTSGTVAPASQFVRSAA